MPVLLRGAFETVLKPVGQLRVDFHGFRTAHRTIDGDQSIALLRNDSTERLHLPRYIRLERDVNQGLAILALRIVEHILLRPCTQKRSHAGQPL